MHRQLAFLALLALGAICAVVSLGALGGPAAVDADVQAPGGDVDDLTALGEESLVVVAAAPAIAPAPSARFTPVHSDDRPPTAPAAVPPYRPPRST